MLLGMGVNNHVVKNLIKYRSSGAKFRTANDLRKIYGMDSTLFDQLHLCIQIQSKQRTSFQSDEKAWVDINIAGVEEWMALPGIGNVLATRIVKYRESLGGFHSIEQVGETYGLAPETMDSIKSMLTLSNLPMKINLNTASIDQLAAHPYISHRQAEAIVNYRSHHGEFTVFDDLAKIYSLNSEWLLQMQPYLACSNSDQPEIATR
jgi:competence ComEA-like helix-hairpin-helix protein